VFCPSSISLEFPHRKRLRNTDVNFHFKLAIILLPLLLTSKFHIFKVTNCEIFELDMNLRTEKEKQRAALIKLREISTVDPGLTFV
jgi:hypothetical protein